jgi:DNA-binding NarL/FixJ family response regulator
VTGPHKSGALDVPSILIADDHELLRSILARLVSAEPGLTLAGVAADGEAVIAMARATRPDLVLMDLAMPVRDGISATREICRLLPGVRVLVLSSSCSRELVRDAMAAGACGYLLKGDSPESLVAGIRAATAGGRPMAQGARELLGS